MVEYVAEFTTNHMGNLNVLLRMTQKAKEAGANWIKMQKKDVENFYSKAKLDAPYLSPYGKTYRDYRTIFEFDTEDWDRFDTLCAELGMKWFTTVQDKASVDWINEYFPWVPMLKIASSNARNTEFIKYLTETFPTIPIVMSVAGSTLGEIHSSVDILGERQIYLLHCVAEYPCPPEHLRLGNIEVLRQEFANSSNVTIGYSGHGEGILDAVYARALGAQLIEKHFCLSRHSFVHHIECSLEPEEFYSMIYSDVYDFLPVEAFEDDFGMSDIEREFLENQTYGNTFLGKESKWTE